MPCNPRRASDGQSEAREFSDLAARLRLEACQLSAHYPAQVPAGLLAAMERERATHASLDSSEGLEAREPRRKDGRALAWGSVAWGSLAAALLVGLGIATWAPAPHDQGLALRKNTMPPRVAHSVEPAVDLTGSAPQFAEPVPFEDPLVEARRPVSFAPESGPASNPALWSTFLELDGSAREGLVDLEAAGKLERASFSL